MAEGIQVVGEKDVVRALHGLADATRNLEPAHQRAGQLLLDRATPRTPRESGSLAASGRVSAASDETSLVYDEVYAGPIHNGWPDHNISPQPWLFETVDESQSAVLDVFADYLEDAIRRF
jgi:hypothetical protein